MSEEYDVAPFRSDQQEGGGSSSTDKQRVSS